MNDSFTRNNKYCAYVDKLSDDLKTTLREALAFINWEKYIHKNSTVFVKPNFTFPYYKKGITTSPQLIKSLLEIIKERTNDVILGESNGGNHSFTAEEAFEGHRMYKICKEVGVKLVNLSNLPWKYVESKIQSKTVKVQLPRLLLGKIDCFISVPVLKVHVVTGVSLSMKNSWGCYPDTMRCLHHQNLSHKLTLIARLLKPKIVLVDGTYALDKHGPMYGEAVKTSLILTANNPVVADALGAMILGIPLEKAKHILMAEKEGVGTTDLQQVRINTNWERFARQFQIKKTLIDRLSTLLFNSDKLARFVMDSPATPLIYKVASILRSPEEKEVVSQMGKHY